MLRSARYMLVRLLVALVVAVGVALSLVDVRAQPAATIEQLLLAAKAE